MLCPAVAQILELISRVQLIIWEFWKPYHFFGYKNLFIIPLTWKMIYMKNMHLYRRKHILASATTGHGSRESYKRLLRFLRVKTVLVYLHSNNKYTMTKTNQKMMKDQVSFFCYQNRSITFPTRIPQCSYFWQKFTMSPRKKTHWEG